jgi:hypothetical protein
MSAFAFVTAMRIPQPSPARNGLVPVRYSSSLLAPSPSGSSHGAKAQYKGTGTINGVTGYDFILTATDGEVNGGGGVDKFRIHITDSATGASVYDNVPGLADDLNNANPQVISGGDIVIHSN